MENSQNIIKSFSIRDSLSPKIWTNPKTPQNAKLKEGIRLKLLEISNQFQEFIGLEINVSDIHMTGSLANFNWSEYSDVDLHLIVDFSQFSQKQKELYTELFKLKKTLFNLQHDIKIFTYDVELYVQDLNEEHTSSGVYSVLFDEWIVVPKKESFEVDKKVLIKKVDSWITKIDETIEQANEEKDLDTSLEFLNKLRKKIKEYRSLGLSKGGEFSYENLVFKFLRRNGYIEKLFDFENDLMDKRLSLENFIKTKPLLSEDLQSPFNKPVSISSKYGMRRGRMHNGVDLRASVGTPVYSSDDGTVIAARFMDRKEKGGGCGGLILIQHPNNIRTKYCHMKKINVQPSQEIKKGDLIGESGGDKGGFGSGNSEGPHLHYEIIVNGKAVDPTTILDFKTGAQITSNDVLVNVSGQTEDGSTKLDKTKEKISDVITKTKEKTSDIFGGLFSSKLFKMFQRDLSDRLQDLIDKNIVIKKDNVNDYNFRIVPVEKAMIFLGYAPSSYNVTAKYNENLSEYIKKFKKENGLEDDDTVDKNDLEIMKSLVKNKESQVIPDKENKPEEQKPISDVSSEYKGTDDDFYKKILEGIGAPVTHENMKFLYAWRQSEKGNAKYNPFNTVLKLDKDKNICLYNCITNVDKKGIKPIDCTTCPEGSSPGVKSYSTKEYGIEATIKALQSKKFDYSCITNGLKNNIGAKKISECESLDLWGTAKLVSKVIDGYENGADYKNPPIATA